MKNKLSDFDIEFSESISETQAIYTLKNAAGEARVIVHFSGGVWREPAVTLYPLTRQIMMTRYELLVLSSLINRAGVTIDLILHQQEYGISDGTANPSKPYTPQSFKMYHDND